MHSEFMLTVKRPEFQFYAETPLAKDRSVLILFFHIDMALAIEGILHNETEWFVVKNTLLPTGGNHHLH